MASRPRRAAAQRANTAITDMVDSDNHINSRTGRTMSSRTSRRAEGKSVAASVTRDPPPSPPESNNHIRLTVKLPASKLRQATSSRSAPSGRQQAATSSIVEGKRNRSQKKSYVVDSSDDEDEDEAEDEVQVEEEDDDEDDEDDEDAEGEDDDMADMGEEDAEGEIVVDDTMDIDAEGDDDEEDAEGEDDDMDVDPIPPPAPVIKVSKPQAKSTPNSKSKGSAKSSAKAAAPQVRDSDDDEELSELESEADEIQDTVKVGGGDDEDAEGEDEEIEAANATEEEDDDDGSDGAESRAETPDLTRMTKRQRARFEENGDALMKLSDEVQAKKHFTAEELSMRRAEMARRRRNLSEKRNEEVKMETINKLLKKQAPKTNRKSQLAGDQTPDVESQKPNPVFVRWTSTKDGSRVGVPDEMLSGPAGRVFIKGSLGRGKMVEEVS
ncbi:PAPA-1-like conserved region-domain-containing protein [Hypomontagnella monticulosa]|nr:PAPA-1-like conserved region-domain-containing protein [Hypomontagnella monticulosa]